VPCLPLKTRSLERQSGIGLSARWTREGQLVSTLAALTFLLVVNVGEGDTLRHAP